MVDTALSFALFAPPAFRIDSIKSNRPLFKSGNGGNKGSRVGGGGGGGGGGGEAMDGGAVTLATGGIGGGGGGGGGAAAVVETGGKSAGKSGKGAFSTFGISSCLEG